MRKLSLILLTILVSSNAFSQVKKPHNLAAFDYKPLHWGFTVGLNSMDFAFKRNPAAANYMHADVIGFQPSGFQVNIVSDLRLSDYWNLRFLPGINLGSRRLIYFVEAENLQYNVAYDMTIGSSFLDFPLLLKYRSKRVNNYRPYLIGGISYRIDMSAKDAFDLDPKNDDRILLKMHDLYFEFGFGVDTYSQYFKFAPEIKLCIGLNDVLNHDILYSTGHQYVESIDRLTSFIVMVNFHFE